MGETDCTIKLAEELFLDRVVGDWEERDKKRFKESLVSYEGYRKFTPGSMEMLYVEVALLTLADQGLNKTQPGNVLVALAGVISELSIFDLLVTHFPIVSYHKLAKCISMRDAAKWEAFKEPIVWLTFWKCPPSDHFTYESSEKLLHDLFERYVVQQ